MPDATPTEVILAPVETASSQETHYQVPPLEGVPIDFANAAPWAFDHDANIVFQQIMCMKVYTEDENGNFFIMPPAKEVFDEYKLLSNRTPPLHRNGITAVQVPPFSDDRRLRGGRMDSGWLNHKPIDKNIFITRLNNLIHALLRLRDTPVNEKEDETGKHFFLCNYCASVAEDTIKLAQQELGSAQLVKLSPTEIRRDVGFIITLDPNDANSINKFSISVPIYQLARAAKIIKENARNYCTENFNDQKATIKAISLQISEGEIIFRVTNSGEFINQREAEKMFDINRAMNADSQRPHFGLAALQRLLQTVDPEHKGAITLDSIPNPDSNDTARFLNTISFKIPVGK